MKAVRNMEDLRRERDELRSQRFGDVVYTPEHPDPEVYRHQQMVDKHLNGMDFASAQMSDRQENTFEVRKYWLSRCRRSKTLAYEWKARLEKIMPDTQYEEFTDKDGYWL